MFRFYPNRKFWILTLSIISLVLLFALAVPAFAQDVEPVIPPDVMTPDQAGELTLTLILTIVSAFAGSALTATIVSVLKMFLPTDPVVLKNVVGGALTIIYWLAVRYGFGSAFESVGQFLIVFVPAFFQLWGTLVGSSIIYQQSIKHGVPLLSYQRTP